MNSFHIFLKVNESEFCRFYKWYMKNHESRLTRTSFSEVNVVNFDNNDEVVTTIKEEIIIFHGWSL